MYDAVTAPDGGKVSRLVSAADHSTACDVYDDRARHRVSLEDVQSAAGHAYPSSSTQWVAQGKEKAVGTGEKMKRLTLDLPEGLHRAMKRRAVEEGVTMVDMAPQAPGGGVRSWAVVEGLRQQGRRHLSQKAMRCRVSCGGRAMTSRA